MSADQPLTGERCANYAKGDCVTNWCTTPCDHCRAIFDARHNHLTRDIKPKGQCPACDRHWKADPMTNPPPLTGDELATIKARAEALGEPMGTAALVALAHDVPRLVAEIERLQARVERLLYESCGCVT